MTNDRNENNNEMQLSRAAGLPVVPIDVATSMANAQPQQQQKPVGLKKVHRLLRGRYPLVIGLGLLFGVAGGLVGFLSVKPMFESKGEIAISPTIPTADSGASSSIPSFDLFLREQMAVLMTPEMAKRAMSKPEWQALNRPVIDPDQAAAEFTKNLTVEIMPGTPIISVAFADLDPKVAQIGATALCSAYKDYYETLDPFDLRSKLTLLASQRDKLAISLGDAKRNLSEDTLKYGTPDLGAFLQAQYMRLAQLQEESEEATADVQEAIAAMGGVTPAINGKIDVQGKPPATPKQLTEVQIAQMDMTMRTYLMQRTELQTEIARLLNVYGKNHPKVVATENDLDIQNKLIQGYVETFNKNYQLNGAPGTAVSPTASLDGKRARMELLKKQYAAQDAYCRDMSSQLRLIREDQDRIDQTRLDWESKSGEYERLDSQQLLMRNQMTIASAPNIATEPAIDKRKELAVLGFLGGGILPALMVILVGLLDSRFRFSDETNTDLGGVPLLGILPNLPDLLTDPDQAATAAHCVHQIRTILQITGHNSDRRAFAVTSGSPGDGKTSLTLALGLSFAASGSRTLLIDGDLMGAGLTARLNVSSEHGVLEAMASQDVLSYIKKTDVSDLGILPVGEAMGGYTGTISPAAVRRLVTEARKNFDVIIIDTGPILGSIEASPIAVAVDGVILCVSRGQHRPLVDRALAHLQAIGAKLSGVVFNRAQAQDFDSSISRMSMKPAPTNGHGPRRPTGQHIGPVAKAVATSVRPASSMPNRE